MPAFVMKVNKVEKHPNADSLFVYEMVSVENIKTQVVANLTNVYSVGDYVIVATSGSKLKDGTYIEESKVRGVVSCGMALGKTEQSFGTDLTSEYCQPVYHIRWPDIESLFNVRKSLKELGTSRPVFYAAKTKLDGTCAGVQVLPNGDILAQSRGEIITPTKDNMGFAAWVEKNKDYFKSLVQDEPFVIFGEWCGQGIQKRCSISKIDKKIFAVFAIQYGTNLDVNPISIDNLLPDNDDVYVIDWHDFIWVDYSNVDKLTATVEILNEWVHKVEQCDPFVKKYFNIEGLGEGLVFYPISDMPPDENGKIFINRGSMPQDEKERILVGRDVYKELVFKAKGEEHKVVKTKEAVQIDPEVAKSIDDFVNLFVTENRLDQIAQRVGGFDTKKTGEFLKGFNADVVKESTAELEASKMVWKDVSNCF